MNVDGRSNRRNSEMLAIFFRKEGASATGDEVREPETISWCIPWV